MLYLIDAFTKKPVVSIGSQTMIIGAMQITLKSDPNAEFIMISARPELDKIFIDPYCFRYRFVQRKQNNIAYAFQLRQIIGKVDAVISVWGDAFTTQQPHQLIKKVFFLKKRNTPMILFTASIDKPKGVLASLLTRAGLNFFDLVTVREYRTQENLISAGYTRSIIMPDTAFVVKQADPKRVNLILKKENIVIDKPWVGLNTSVLLNNLMGENVYCALMREIINFIQCKLNAGVLLIPHQIIPLSLYPQDHPCRKAKGGDDRYVMDLLSKGLKSSKINALHGEYLPAEYKGIIGKCSLFIGGRMHAVIAALTAFTPSIIMEYSHKADGVMHMFGLQEYAWKITDPRNKLIELIEKAWEKRSNIRKKLYVDVPKLMEKSYELGLMTKNTIIKNNL